MRLNQPLCPNLNPFFFFEIIVVDLNLALLIANKFSKFSSLSGCLQPRTTPCILVVSTAWYILLFLRLLYTRFAREMSKWDKSSWWILQEMRAFMFFHPLRYNFIKLGPLSFLTKRDKFIEIRYPLDFGSQRNELSEQESQNSSKSNYDL